MKKKTSYIVIFTLLFLISIFILAGCNQENKQTIKEPTIEEKIEGTWFAGREPLELPSSYLILTSSGKAYLSTNGVKYSTNYKYNVYSGNYYISEDNYLFLELTHYKVSIYSENAFEVFNTNLESYNNGEVELVMLEIKNNSLITIEEQPLRYTKMGD